MFEHVWSLRTSWTLLSQDIVDTMSQDFVDTSLVFLVDALFDAPQPECSFDGCVLAR